MFFRTARAVSVHPFRWRVFSASLVSTALVVACRGASPRPADSAAMRADSLQRDSIARARQDSVNRAQPGYVVDSILPTEEAVRRFKQSLGGPEVTTLDDESASREA